MDKKQLTLLFVIVNVIMIAVSGLVPLLPVRVIRLGASEAGAGYFMAIAYLSITLGTISGTIGSAVYPAFTADLTSEQNRGLGISLIGATGNLCVIIGFGITGVAIQQIGLNPTILIGAALPLICIGLLLGIGKRG